MWCGKKSLFLLFFEACVCQRNHTCGHVSFFNIQFCVYLSIQYIWHSEQDFWDKNQTLINPNVSLGARHGMTSDGTSQRQCICIMYHVVTLHFVLLCYFFITTDFCFNYMCSTVFLLCVSTKTPCLSGVS